MKFTFQGTGQTTSSSPGAVVVVIVLVLLFGTGAVAAISAVLIGLFIAAAVTAVLALAVGGYLVYRAYRRQSAGIPSFAGIVRPPVVHELPGYERPAIAPAQQHFHLHVGNDTDPARVAAILRQAQGGLSGGQPDITT